MVAIFRKRDGHILSNGQKRKKERRTANHCNEEYLLICIKTGSREISYMMEMENLVKMQIDYKHEKKTEKILP